MIKSVITQKDKEITDLEIRRRLQGVIGQYVLGNWNEITEKIGFNKEQDNEC